MWTAGHLAFKRSLTQRTRQKIRYKSGPYMSHIFYAGRLSNSDLFGFVTTPSADVNFIPKAANKQLIVSQHYMTNLL